MRILVVGPAWVGDMVMAQSLLIELKRRYKGVVIDMLAPPASLAVAERMPEVRKTIPLPIKHGVLDLGQRWKIAQSLNKEGYSRAYLTPNSLKSALIPFLARIPKRIGWRGEMRYLLLNDIRRLDPEQYPKMVERFAALALPNLAHLPEQIPHPKLRIHDGERQGVLERLGLSVGERPVLALCPGAEFGPSKRWPEEYFAEVAAQRIDDGWQVWIFGSPADKACGKSIRDRVGELAGEQSSPHCHNIAGATSLPEAIDVMSLSDAVVSNDSGLMHIAAALNRPQVVVYGSTSAQFTPPLSKKTEILSISLDCSPCFERVCALGHTRCLRDLAPQVVLEALNRLPQPVAVV